MPRNILFVASECAHFVKSGGLGDVVAALPAALHALGHDVRIVLPRYDAIPLHGLAKHAAPLGVPLGPGDAWCAVYETRLPGTDVPVYLLDHQALYGRGYLYDPPGGYAEDGLTRFAVLSRGALQLCLALGFAPDVVHAHDWPTAILPVMTNTVAHAPFAGTASVLTIHNLAHQPLFAPAQLLALDVPASELREDALLDRGGVNPLKGGLYHSTMLTTVSPTYAREIRTPAGGAGLHDVLDFRGADLVGILNGIDAQVWNPATDAALPARFDAADLWGKATCKRALQRELGLAERADVPLIGVISRLSAQKGIDVILAALETLLALDVQLVVLGSGDPASEGYLHTRSLRGGDRFRAFIGFNDGLAHRIEAGADLFLMPSRFEPCGLNQLYSQRYGTLPIVRATGGLEDTVENYDAQTGLGTGFKLWTLTPEALVDAVAWAVETYRERPAHFRAMQLRAMQKDWGWGPAAAQYTQVYEWALQRRRGIHYTVD